MFDDLDTRSEDFSWSLTQRLRDLRKSNTSDEIADELWRLLQNIEEEFPYLDVIRELCAERVRAGKHDELADLHALALSRFPTSLNGHIAYSEHLIWSDGEPNLALEISTKAVELAKQNNSLVRHALQGKARAAKKLGLFSVVEDTLREILATDQMDVRGDIQYEIDVVNDIPKGTVDDSLVREFQSRCKPRVTT